MCISPTIPHLQTGLVKQILDQIEGWIVQTVGQMDQIKVQTVGQILSKMIVKQWVKVWIK